MGVSPDIHFHAFVFLVSQFRPWSQRGRIHIVMFCLFMPLWQLCVPRQGTLCCGLLRTNLQEWFTGARRVLLPLGNNFKQRWFWPRSSCWWFKPFKQERELMSNHKSGGMASKERLYELWMLYYTKVSASAEDLTLTPVVAAESPLPEVSDMSR